MATKRETSKPYFQMYDPHKARPMAASGLQPWSVPDLCAAYQWPTGLAGGGKIGIVELDGGWVLADLQQFFSSIGQPMPQITDVSVNGVVNNPNQHLGDPRDPDYEVALDIQVAAAAYYVATGKRAEIRVYWADDIAPGVKQATADGCDVFSISWGNSESVWKKAGQQVGRDFIKEMEDAAIAATNAGMVVLAASGDNDSADATTGDANVDVPASCPHVIGCGGTQKTPTSETVWNETPGSAHGVGTGGGFSLYFPEQGFQANAPHGSGRMVPDVAANAARPTGYTIVCHNESVAVGGTSAVAPLYAGLFAAFGTKLGFVTPKLWSNQTCFNDITLGDNGRFRAAVGPDPCTGLGSPIASRLSALFAPPAAPAAELAAAPGAPRSRSYAHVAPASPSQKPFPAFRDFVNSLHVAAHANFAARSDAKVASADQFEEMKRHVARLYQGVDVAHSFADGNGQIFDCVPIQQQPAARRAGMLAVASPPDLPHPGGAVSTGESPVQPQLSATRKDAFGNTMACPPGTIPMRRITLEELSRFESLNDFFRKAPRKEGRHPRLSFPMATGLAHKYAHAYQVVSNLGGHNFLNVWDPSVIGPDQVFSLAQHWYAAESPSGVQTVEVGWQVFPQKYGNSNPCLFIYWTADGYQNTGCYNLDCHAFIQTNPHWAFGAALSPVSVSGGTQYELEVSYLLYQNNWWLYLGGTDAASAVGYYPASLFNGGPLATAATDVDYGGETVASVNWPPMGSGAFAAAGWQQAAYQRDIYYFPTTGGAQFVNLIPAQPSPHSYTINTFSAAAPWNSYFYFGGSGGTSD
jgi:hypothetical protein